MIGGYACVWIVDEVGREGSLGTYLPARYRKSAT